MEYAEKPKVSRQILNKFNQYEKKYYCVECFLRFCIEFL